MIADGARRVGAAMVVALLLGAGACGDDGTSKEKTAPDAGDDTGGDGDGGDGDGGDGDGGDGDGGDGDGGDGDGKGAAGSVLVSTSHVARLVNLSDGTTKEVLGDRLRWPQNPGHLYQVWDVSPDGTRVVSEGGFYADDPETRLVVYAFADDGATGKVLIKNGGPLGNLVHTPCWADANTVYVVANGKVWSVDPALDETQEPVEIKAIADSKKLAGPVVWDAKCTGFLAQGFRSGGTNEDSDNVGYFSLEAGTTTQLSYHYANNKGITYAQNENFAACSGSGCVVAKNGGRAGSMGFLPNGHVWLSSNRDAWRAQDNSYPGTASLVLEVDPAAPEAFEDLPSYDGPGIRAIRRDGKLQAHVTGDSVEVLDEQGTRVVLSSPDFNIANSAGYMRFVPAAK